MADDQQIEETIERLLRLIPQEEGRASEARNMLVSARILWRTNVEEVRTQIEATIAFLLGASIMAGWIEMELGFDLMHQLFPDGKTGRPGPGAASTT